MFGIFSNSNHAAIAMKNTEKGEHSKKKTIESKYKRISYLL